jgi:hypothetical protein
VVAAGAEQRGGGEQGDDEERGAVHSAGLYPDRSDPQTSENWMVFMRKKLVLPVTFEPLVASRVGEVPDMLERELKIKLQNLYVKVKETLLIAHDRGVSRRRLTSLANAHAFADAVLEAPAEVVDAQRLAVAIRLAEQAMAEPDTGAD